MSETQKRVQVFAVYIFNLVVFSFSERRQIRIFQNIVDKTALLVL